MPETPTPGQFNHEESVRQHREDVERTEQLDGAKTTYQEHLTTARDLADTAKHPEVWDEASAEYQAATKVKIAAAVKVEDYETAKKLIAELRTHRTGAEKNQKRTAFIERASAGNETKRKFIESITEDDYKAMRAEVEYQQRQGRWRLVAHLANELQVIDPSFDPTTELTNQDRQAIRERWRYSRREGYRSEFAEFTSNLRTIDPTFNPEKEITNQDLETMLAELRFFRRQEQWKDFAHLAKNIWTIDPSFHSGAEISNKDLQAMRAELQSCRISSRWNAFTSLARDLRAIDPSFNPITEVTDQDRQAILKVLERNRKNGYWGDFAEIASALFEIS